MKLSPGLFVVGAMIGCVSAFAATCSPILPGSDTVPYFGNLGWSNMSDPPDSSWMNVGVYLDGSLRVRHTRKTVRIGFGTPA